MKQSCDGAETHFNTVMQVNIMLIRTQTTVRTYAQQNNENHK